MGTRKGRKGREKGKRRVGGRVGVRGKEGGRKGQGSRQGKKGAHTRNRTWVIKATI